MANNDENHSVNMLHNSGIRETRSDVCRSNNLPGYYIKRERSVRYILLEITRAHRRERIHTHSLNYGNCWLVNCSLRCPLGDCTETRTFTCVLLSPTRPRMKKDIAVETPFWNSSHLCGEVKKKEKIRERTDSIYPTFPSLLSNEKRISVSGASLFLLLSPSRFFRCTDNIETKI